MEFLVFYRINNYYVYLRDISDPDTFLSISSSDYSMYHEDYFAKYKDLCTYQGKEFHLDFDIPEIDLREEYLVARSTSTNSDYITLIPLSELRTSVFGPKKPDIIALATSRARIIVLAFKMAQRQKLLQNLFSTKTDVRQSVQAFADYCFFQKFALWIYNPSSKHFCCLCSSHVMPREYVSQDADTSLYDFLLSANTHDFRTPNKAEINCEYAEGMNTLNRIKLCFGGDDEVGILDFLSCHLKFLLRERTLKMIKHHIESKYVESQQKSLLALHKIEEAFSGYRLGHLRSFARVLTSRICDQLSFQACSIFEYDGKNNTLNLLGVTDTEKMGKSKKKVTYDLNKPTFTGAVFKSGSGYACSYDIENDPQNSHTYDETTEGEGKTWIAMTLRSENAKWGILRVKNKHNPEDNLSLINFTPSDFFILRSVCIHLSNVFSLERGHKDNRTRMGDLEKKRSEVKHNFEELKTFYNVFLHEIRTPISTFSTSPLRITRLLQAPIVTDQIKRDIELKVNDIKIMGARLAFIANTYYFNELVKSRRPERLSVLQDIIFPVLHITREYVKKQHDVDIRVGASSLERVTVTGDKMLLNIVFNTLISNAGKYAIGSQKPIAIYGEYDPSSRYFLICVDNFGLPIYPNEKDLVFDSGYRGKAVLDQKIGGTGIGLYLAREIMHKQNGDLILSSLQDPVTFKIKVPMKWRT